MTSIAKCKGQLLTVFNTVINLEHSVPTLQDRQYYLNDEVINMMLRI
jgi:hypothetical protein